MPSFVTCGPNEAIIVSGCCHTRPIIRAGGRVFVWHLFHRVQRLSLNTMTLNVESAKVYSGEGVPVTVKGVAQVKIQGKDLSALKSASEMFLDKTEDEIMDIARATLDGHQRSMIATKTIDDIYKDRKSFSSSVKESAQTDLIDMGLTLVTYTVQNITDDEGYLKALSEQRTVAVKSEARREVAQFKSETDRKNMETDQNKRKDELRNEKSLEMKRLDYELNISRYLKSQYENKAKSEKAGDLKKAEINFIIAQQEWEVLVVEKEREAELMLKKKELKELELIDQVQKKADFHCEREKLLAQAFKETAITRAKAEANRITELAEARAEIIKLQKEAEAKVLREKALAFKEFGNAAKLEMVLGILPRLTAEIAGPITDCNKITSISQDGSVGFSRITSEIMEVLEQICNSVGAIGTMSSQSLGGNYNNSNDNRHDSDFKPGGGTQRKVS